MGMSLWLVGLIIATLLCAYGADRLAKRKHWQPRGWVISTLFLGPLPLILLLLLPGRRIDGPEPDERNRRD